MWCFTQKSIFLKIKTSTNHSGQKYYVNHVQWMTPIFFEKCYQGCVSYSKIHVLKHIITIAYTIIMNWGKHHNSYVYNVKIIRSLIWRIHSEKQILAWLQIVFEDHIQRELIIVQFPAKFIKNLVKNNWKWMSRYIFKNLHPKCIH